WVLLDIGTSHNRDSAYVRAQREHVRPLGHLYGVLKYFSLFGVCQAGGNQQSRIKKSSLLEHQSQKIADCFQFDPNRIVIEQNVTALILLRDLIHTFCDCEIAVRNDVNACAHSIAWPARINRRMTPDFETLFVG